MSLFRKLETFEPSPFLLAPLNFPLPYEVPKLSFSLDFFDPFDIFDGITDVTRIGGAPFSSCHRRIMSTSGLDLSLRSFCHQVTAFELAFDRVIEADRKYSWTAEISCPQRTWVDKKYKLTAEIEIPEKIGVDTKYKWTADINGGKRDKHVDAIGGKQKAVAIKIEEPGSAAGVRIEAPRKVEKEKEKAATRAVEIEDPPVDHGAIILRQAFGKRAGAVARARGKTKELSPQDAALKIQITFRAYLIRRSKALRSLRQLAVTKAKLKEIRVLFNDFSYRQRVARDKEERKRFSERIIALLLAVDAIQGVDLMVRASRRSMLDELEAMLNAVDPLPRGKISFMQRKFNLPGYHSE